MAPASAAAKQSSSNKDENHSSSGTRKTSSSSAARGPQEQSLKCPRCDSQNTKFCYYNNYSLTQPRHFCKTCRRYWTKGGALRNVPIGGGCRKNKKSNKPSSRLGNSLDSKEDDDAANNNMMSSTDMGGLKFFHGLTPAMDFQLGGLSFPRLQPAAAPTPGGLYSQFSSFGDTSCSVSPLMGFNFPFSSMLRQGENNTTTTTGEVVPEMGSSNHHQQHTISLASSIESLSSINQDLHWKLQQQRLAMLFGGDHQSRQIKDGSININISSNNIPLGGGGHHHEVQKPQPILFHNLDGGTPKTNAACGGGGLAGGDDHEHDHDNGSMRRDQGSGVNLSTEWFFDNCNYAVPVTPTPTNSSSNGNDQNMNNWSGIQAWSNMSQYSAL